MIWILVLFATWILLNFTSLKDKTMSRKNKNMLITWGIALLSSLMLSTAQAGIPLWTFSPLTPTTWEVPETGVVNVMYTVQNQSPKPKLLSILPTPGVQQTTPCQLSPKGQANDTCILMLTITGSQLHARGIHGGPNLCQANPGGIPNPNQCYQPSMPDVLNLTKSATPGETTLTASVQELALSINDITADTPLSGNSRTILIENTGSEPANNLQVNTSGFPDGTFITMNTCTGTLEAGDTCDITITPGDTASSDASNNACTSSPGTEPVPTIVTISSDNAPSTQVNTLILGYGCIYQGGFLFSVDDTTPNTGSIGGKVAALTDEPGNPIWSDIVNETGADSTTDGAANTNLLASPPDQYPAAQACLNKSDQGFSDWYLPAICEMGRLGDVGFDAGCGTTNPNLFWTLHKNALGNFDDDEFPNYWSSTEFDNPDFPGRDAWFQNFSFTNGAQANQSKDDPFFLVRCVRAFTP